MGSDQIWLPLGLYTNFFNLLFVHEAVPKVAYSSSFGVSQIPWWQKKQTKHYLERFDAVAVREMRGKEIVEELSGQQAKVVLDPTLLLTESEWANEAGRSALDMPEPYIFCYFLGTNQKSRAATRVLRQQTGYQVVSIPHMDEYVAEDESFGDVCPYDVSPNDFLQLVRNAEYVCTDSFHCSVFAVLFKKKFTTFYRFSSSSGNSRNSRIDSLFALLGLESRLFCGDIAKQFSQAIDYESVGRELTELRNDSLAYLEKSLALSQKGCC